VIRIEQVRALERAAALRSYGGGTKVFLVLGADALQPQAANALLKTLEEPTPETLFLLTATDAGCVLPTIVSRCQEVPLRPVPAAEIAEALTRDHDVDATRAQALAGLAGGRPGWAIRAAADPSLVETRQRDAAQLAQLLRQGIAERLRVAASASDAAEVRTRLEHWLAWWRDALLVKAACSDYVVQAESLSAIRRAAHYLSAQDIAAAMRRLHEARVQLEQNINVRLVLEGVLLDLPVLQLSAHETLAR
jgi:DNA polymerase-3 subunit delta'